MADVLPIKIPISKDQESKHESGAAPFGKQAGEDEGWYADPRIAHVIMVLTYLTAAPGLGLAIHGATERDVDYYNIGAILAVGVGGLLSFLRHSVFHRSDAIRLGWDTGVRNNFQIEAGIANLAWGLVAILAVACDWGAHVVGSSFLMFGLYLASSSVMLFSQRFEKGASASSRSLGPLVAMASYGAVMMAAGILAMEKFKC